MVLYKILFAVGRDKPGIINTVSAFLSEKGCNIEDSRMSVIGDEFALFLLLSGSHPSIEKVKAELPDFEKNSGLTIFIKDSGAPSQKKNKDAVYYGLSALGMDHPGIVNEITGLLKRYGANVESLESDVTLAPVSGTQVFHMHLRMAVPSGTKLTEMEEELEALSNKLNTDITIFPEKI